jgi:hypothetical protein
MKNIIIITIILIIGILIILKLKPKKYSYIIPAYIPLGERFDDDFDGIAEFSKKNKVITIVNPNNGPISKKENQYYFEKLEKKIKQIQDNGGQIIGYVSTDYGNRDEKKVKDDIDLWKNQWNIDGIFLDEGMGSCNGNCERLIKKYKDYYDYIGDQIIVTNAGYIDDNYDKFLSDKVIMIVFENTYKEFISPHNYLGKLDLHRGQKGILLHTTPIDIDNKRLKQLYKKYDLNYIYLTPKNWDTISLKILGDL